MAKQNRFRGEALDVLEHKRKRLQEAITALQELMQEIEQELQQRRKS